MALLALVSLAVLRSKSSNDVLFFLHHTLGVIRVAYIPFYRILNKKLKKSEKLVAKHLSEII